MAKSLLIKSEVGQLTCKVCYIDRGGYRFYQCSFPASDLRVFRVETFIDLIVGISDRVMNAFNNPETISIVLESGVIINGNDDLVEALKTALAEFIDPEPEDNSKR